MAPAKPPECGRGRGHPREGRRIVAHTGDPVTLPHGVGPSAGFNRAYGLVYTGEGGKWSCNGSVQLTERVRELN